MQRRLARMKQHKNNMYTCEQHNPTFLIGISESFDPQEFPNPTLLNGIVEHHRALKAMKSKPSGRAWDPRRLQDGFKTPKMPHVASKIIKKSTKMSSKSSNFGLREILGGNLKGFWEGMVGAKLDPKID